MLFVLIPRKEWLLQFTFNHWWSRWWKTTAFTCILSNVHINLLFSIYAVVFDDSNIWGKLEEIFKLDDKFENLFWFIEKTKFVFNYIISPQLVSTVFILTSWILALVCALPILVNAKLETRILDENIERLLGWVNIVGISASADVTMLFVVESKRDLTAWKIGENW